MTKIFHDLPAARDGKDATWVAAPISPAQPRDEALGALTTKIEQLHRSHRALHALAQRSAQPSARVVPVTPHLEDRPAGTFPPRQAAGPVNDPWWPRHVLPQDPLVPPPGLETYALGSARLAAVAISVLGLRGADLDHAAALIGEDLRHSQDFKPVFLTDNADFSPFAQRGFAVEYIPSNEPRADGDALGVPPDRYAFLARKWGFQRSTDLRATRAPVAPAAPLPRKDAFVPAPKPGKRRRAAVIAWDMGHNPVGRAMVLYDLLDRDWEVELVGPLWSRFGGKVWGPIAESGRRVRGFACATLEDFWPAALALAASSDYDLIVVCKPRLPALLLGALIKQRCGCPLVLDVDDFELSFFKDETTASLTELEGAGPAALLEPYGELATRACDGVIGDADALVVSNVALRNRFGGTILRHARDEVLFHEQRFDRMAERRQMGISPADFALVFVGTARAHKGVFDIARTLAALPDKRFVLHLVGDIHDRRTRNELDRHKGARIVYHPDCAFTDLPARIVAADAVVLLQDASHPISQYQIPAKVSDASAFGLPILTTDVPPMRDLALQGLVQVITPDALGATLTGLLADRTAGRGVRARAHVREAFEADLGFRVNRERLELAIARAAKAGPGLPHSFARLIDITARAYAQLRLAKRPPAMATARASARAPLDLVMFWKQNDTGLYGRRSDLLMKHLLASGRVGRILQFDAPLEVAELARLSEPGRGSAAPLILANAVDNQFALRDTANHRLRTYLWDKQARPAILPEVGASLADYPAYVEAQMQAAGIRAEDALAWVCPVVFDFPAVARRITFRGVIGDLIDDQRNFEMSPAYRPRIVASYEATLPLCDLTFTNCAAQVEAFADLTRRIHVVPNGTELPPAEPGPLPPALAALSHPIAGYVGNLRDRIDWGLLRATALAMPQVNFAIVGGGARREDAALLDDLPNVTFTGVVPYEQVQACIRCFDVALVPHLRNALTASMNPLKVYNYFAADRPIVSTEVENVDAALQPFIRFASGPDAFAAAITQALAAPRKRRRGYQKALSGITWETRARSVISLVDTWLASRR